jgi:hypothetical protein
MTAIQLSQRSPSDLVDHAVVLGRRHFLGLLGLGLVPLLGATWAGHLSAEAGGMRTLTGLAFTVAAYMLHGLSEAAIIAGAWELLHGRPAGLLPVWAMVARRGPSAAIGYSIKAIMIILGMFLVVPGFYLLALYFAVPAATVIEGVGIRASFARSRALARDSMMRILLSIGLVWIVTAAVSIGLQLGLPVLGVARGSPLIYLAGVLWSLLIAPIRGALTALVYLDIRMRREGYDLQSLLSSLPGAA